MARQRRSAALAALVGLLAAGCTGSGGGASSSGSATTPLSTSRSVPSAASTSSASGQRPASPAVAAAVRSAFQTFFASKSSLQQVQASLQNGALFHATLVQQGKSQYASKSAARVKSVDIVSPHVAAVTYDILSNGGVVLQNVYGHAVNEHGRWVVAAETFCALLKLEGSAPSACANASATALPS